MDLDCVPVQGGREDIISIYVFKAGRLWYPALSFHFPSQLLCTAYNLMYNLMYNINVYGALCCVLLYQRTHCTPLTLLCTTLKWWVVYSVLTVLTRRTMQLYLLKHYLYTPVPLLWTMYYISVLYTTLVYCVVYYRSVVYLCVIFVLICRLIILGFGLSKGDIDKLIFPWFIIEWKKSTIIFRWSLQIYAFSFQEVTKFLFPFCSDHTRARRTWPGHASSS